jgi:hypothetical protein
MTTFTSTVCGYPARTVFDCQCRLLLTSSSFFDVSRSSVPISVVTTAGAFLCLVNLTEQPVDTVYDLKLGRDWLSLQSVPDAYMLLSNDTCLVFSSSPFSAVRSCDTSEFVSS